MQDKIPVVIDCDPGVDDAHALLLALSSPRLEVRAITTVAGNMPVWMTTDNALRVTELVGRPVPVSQGCAEALYRSEIPHSEMFHGKNGLGNAQLPEVKGQKTELHGVETLHREIQRAQGRLHIIALGPLTNIAMLLKLYPEVKPQIAHLTVMGGSRERGNITPTAEFNFYCDGEAADIVMRSGLPITLVGLDGCENAALTADDAQRITGMPSQVSELLRQMWDFNLALAQKLGEDGFVIHDAIAVASVIDPELLQTQRCTVEVLTKKSYGKCEITPDEQGNVLFATHTNRERFLELCEAAMTSYPL